ncbi:MAG: AAA family ATPase [Promethearchaeia archaeon]
MLIRKMEIENVKTHKDTTINFNEGLNILYGNNGAGKSTILEMIGFVLFDFLKSKTYHADYVRDVENDKPSYGRIKIWINGLKNEIYQITRSIGKTEIDVLDENGDQLSPPINTISKFKIWIKKQLGVKYEIDLETLFNAAIGIPQGMIVNSFLKSPKKRKEYFDKIFQLDTYETYWENLASIESAYKEEVIEVQNKISGLVGETKDKKQQVQKKEDLTKEISTISAKLTDHKKQNEKIAKELDNLKEVKDELDVITSDCKELEVKKKKEEENLKVLQEQLNESIEAKKICSKNKHAYEEYVKNSETKKELIEKSKKLTNVKDKLNQITQDYNDITNKIKNKTEKIEEVKNSRKKVKELKPKYQKYESLEEKLKQIEKEITIISSTKNSIKNKQKHRSELKQEINSLEDEINKLSEIEQKLEEIKDFEKRIADLRLTIKSTKNDLSFFQNNQNKIKSQLCPFTDQQCKNILEGEFDIDFFIKQIELKNQELKDQKEELSKLRDKIKEKNQVKNKIENLKEKKVKKAEYQKQLSKLEKEISDLKKKTTQEEDLLDARKVMINQKKDLKKDYNEYLIHTEKSQNLEEIRKEIEPLQKKENSIKEKQSELELAVKKYEHVPKELENKRKKENKLEAAYNEYQQNLNEANKLSQRQQKVNKTQNKLEKIKKAYKQKVDKQSELSEKYDEKRDNELQEIFQKNKEKIIQWKEKLNNLEERVDEIKELLKKLDEKEKELEDLRERKLRLNAEKTFIRKIRTWLREFKPKMRKDLIGKVNREASQIYRNIRGDQNTALYWNEDYEIKIRKAKNEKGFIRLSGGEKMAAALSVRLAILKTLTSAKFAIFDEPTTNLDPDARNNLSKYINNIKGFNQLFVISHDNAFNRHSEYVIKLTKDDNEQTHIHYLTNV